MSYKFSICWNIYWHKHTSIFTFLFTIFRQGYFPFIISISCRMKIENWGFNFMQEFLQISWKKYHPCTTLISSFIFAYTFSNLFHALNRYQYFYLQTGFYLIIRKLIMNNEICFYFHLIQIFLATNAYV